jgi:uridine kinase
MADKIDNFEEGIQSIGQLAGQFTIVPVLIVVRGYPSSGKTHLIHALRERLGVGYICSQGYLKDLVEFHTLSKEENRRFLYFHLQTPSFSVDQPIQREFGRPVDINVLIFDHKRHEFRGRLEDYAVIIANEHAREKFKK